MFWDKIRVAGREMQDLFWAQLQRRGLSEERGDEGGEKEVQCRRSGGVADTWQALFSCVSKCDVSTVNIFKNNNMNKFVPALFVQHGTTSNLLSVVFPSALGLLQVWFYCWPPRLIQQLLMQGCNPLCQLSYGVCCVVVVCSCGVVPRKLLPATGM